MRKEKAKIIAPKALFGRLTSIITPSSSPNQGIILRQKIAMTDNFNNQNETPTEDQLTAGEPGTRTFDSVAEEVSTPFLTKRTIRKKEQ